MDSPTTQSAPAPAAPAAPASEALSLDAAAERFESLWEAGGEAGPGAVSHESAPAAPKETAADPSVPNGTADAAPIEGAATDPASAADATAPASAEPQDFDAWLTEQKVDPSNLSLKVKVDGKEAKATVAELVKAYELSQAGHARMAEVAKAKQVFEQHTAQAIQAFQQRAIALEAVGKQVEAAYLAPFQQQVEAAEQAGDRGWQAYAIQQKRDAEAWFKNNLQSITQAREQQALTQRQQAAPQEREKMLAARPEWREKSRLHADHAAAREFGRGLGFTEADFDSISDHRHILVLHGAAQTAAAQQAVSTALGRPVAMQDIVALALEAAKVQVSMPEVTKKVAAAPPMTSRPGVRAVAPKDSRTAAITAAKAQARKSGDGGGYGGHRGYADDDAAAIFELLG